VLLAGVLLREALTGARPELAFEEVGELHADKEKHHH
jgi:hypothetical protein